MKRLLPLVGVLLLTVSAGPDNHSHQDGEGSPQVLRERAEGLRLRLRAGGDGPAHMAGMAALTPEQMEEVKAWLATAPEFLQGHVGQMMEMMHGGMMGPGGPGMGFVPPAGWECEREMENGELEIECTVGGGDALAPAFGIWRGPASLAPSLHGAEWGLPASNDDLDAIRNSRNSHAMGKGMMRFHGGEGRHSAGGMGPGGPQVVPFPGGIVVLFGGQGPGQGRGAMMGMGGGMMEMMERMHGPDGMMGEMGGGGGMMEMMERMHGPDGMMGEMGGGGGMMERMERMHGPDGMMGTGPKHGPGGMMGMGGGHGGGPGMMGGGAQVIPFPGGVVILFGGSPRRMHMGGGMGMMGRDDMVMHTPDGEMFDPRIHLDARPGDGDRSPLSGGAARHGYPL